MADSAQITSPSKWSKLDKVWFVRNTNSFFDFIDLSAIFLMFAQEGWKLLFIETWKYLLSTVTFVAAAINVTASWVGTYLDQKEVVKNGVTVKELKKGNLFKSVMDTLSSVAIMTAVAISFVGLAFFTPYIFTINLAIGAVHNFVQAAYNFGRFKEACRRNASPDEKQKLVNKVIVHAVLGVVLALVGVAVPFVMIAAHANPVLAYIGMSAGIVAGGFFLAKAVNIVRAKRAAKYKKLEEADGTALTHDTEAKKTPGFGTDARVKAATTLSTGIRVVGSGSSSSSTPEASSSPRASDDETAAYAEKSGGLRRRVSAAATSDDVEIASDSSTNSPRAGRTH